MLATLLNILTRLKTCVITKVLKVQVFTKQWSKAFDRAFTWALLLGCTCKVFIIVPPGTLVIVSTFHSFLFECPHPQLIPTWAEIFHLTQVLKAILTDIVWYFNPWSPWRDGNNSKNVLSQPVLRIKSKSTSGIVLRWMLQNTFDGKLSLF